ncbi:MAG: hypothetical protein ROZ37_19745 [Aromatoleum sp.]|uniref:hypothetical protein n=1 Tax=Aromatoleum sp. TaxID=2307007 RepID=UPI0028957BD6|nr:hypothetical protein [Aromatoleum sp.]MDT3672562.1 hypothetical protein [Aromatoleum sp.]
MHAIVAVAAARLSVGGCFALEICASPEGVLYSIDAIQAAVPRLGAASDDLTELTMKPIIPPVPGPEPDPAPEPDPVPDPSKDPEPDEDDLPEVNAVLRPGGVAR